MAIKTLLVYPEIPPTYWSLKYALPFIGKRAVFPPLGLMTVAAMLPDDFDVTLVDMNVEPLRESAIAGADLIITSSMIVQKDSLEKVIGLCKKHGKTVVAGGPYPTSMNAQIPGVDHFVLNEAEVTLPAFLEDYRNGCAKPVYSDTAKPDLSLTPAPRFDLIRKSRYSTMALQYSRGCPHNCEFCDIIEMFGRVPRTKTPAQFLQEMDLLYEEGWRGSLFVVDDNFIGNRREVKKLLPEIASWQQERNYPFNLFTEATLVLAEDEQLMDQMVLAGFNMVFVGIETPDRETLAVTGKTQNLRGDMLQSVRAIQAKGMEVSAGFILGFDGDKDDIFDRQIRFIQDAAIPTAMVGVLTALPNTQLYRRLYGAGPDHAGLRGRKHPRPQAQLRPHHGPREALRGIQEGHRHDLQARPLLRPLPPPAEEHEETHDQRPEGREHGAEGLHALPPPPDLFLLQLALLEVHGPGLSRQAQHARRNGDHGREGASLLQDDTALPGAGAISKMPWIPSRGPSPRRPTGLSVPDLRLKVAELEAYRDRVLAEMRARYRKIHKDFRVYADDALASFKSTLDELIAKIAAQGTPSPSY